ncbi:PPK2 family polyphosphate:nucleotide phosphotransferase [Jatrophihabitans sp. GAS493]|uniref:PPK2 family polyphosphate kinase n=1 Tax=Jatrophihabitans sp. GAS493 TaxID=1907575 RepID=UPI000BB79963|nr:PPK2 family polyphosphate kinase [Jatrophihabitans sp. GAS493]SOD74046.1 PPK2 family polyphosphate:nucleotide phosphotransferase [Jatrophihabitans sp. GAS493]
MAPRQHSLRSALAVAPGTVNLAGYDSGDTPLAPGKKKATESATLQHADDLAQLQERLFAERKRSLLLVLQGIDTAGKGGVISHVVGLLGPAGTTVTAFKKPTPEEAAHHFLWRIRRALPDRGMIAAFDRSHYEDVIVPRVHETIPQAEWAQRYDEINAFESALSDSGTVIVKCFLNISYATQRDRLLARLDDPTKRWKFREGDIDERAYWSDYQVAYTAMVQNCSTEVAPWYIVPSDHKWYRNWAVGEIVRETLAEMDPQYPATDLDLPRLARRLAPPY